VSPYPVLVACVLGAMVGDNLLYYLSREGSPRLCKFEHKLSYGKLSEYRLLLENHIYKTIFITRFIAGARFLGPYIAGTKGVQWKKFFLMNGLAGLLVGVVFILIGYHFDSQILKIVTEIGELRHTIFVVLIILFGFIVSRALMKYVDRAEEKEEEKIKGSDPLNLGGLTPLFSKIGTDESLLEEVKSSIRKGAIVPRVSIVYFCHDGGGNFLLHKRSANTRDEHGRWDVGGGGLDFGKTVMDTLREEVKEEWGCDIKKAEFLGHRDVFREDEGVKTHWLALDWLVLVNKEQAKNGEPHKFEEIGWFKLGEFPTPMHSQLPAALGVYNERLGMAHVSKK